MGGWCNNKPRVLTVKLKVLIVLMLLWQEIADWFAFEFPHQSHYALLMRMQSTEDAAALIAAASLADPPPESASSTSVAAGNGSSASRGSIAVAGGGESTSTGGRGGAAISSVLERYGGVADNRERIVRLWTDAGVQRCIVQGRRLEPQLTEAEEQLSQCYTLMML